MIKMHRPTNTNRVFVKHAVKINESDMSAIDIITATYIGPRSRGQGGCAEWIGYGDDGGTVARAGRQDTHCEEKANALAVVHEEHLQVGNVEDTELEEAVGHQETSLLVGTVADLHVKRGALEMATETSIHTVGLAPGLLFRTNTRQKTSSSSSTHTSINICATGKFHTQFTDIFVDKQAHVPTFRSKYSAEQSISNPTPICTETDGLIFTRSVWCTPQAAREQQRRHRDLSTALNTNSELLKPLSPHHVFGDFCRVCICAIPFGENRTYMPYVMTRE